MEPAISETMDPEWQPYLGLYGSKEAWHPQAGPCFICEGRYLTEEALKSARCGTLRILSVAVTPRQAAEFQPHLPEGTPLLMAEDDVLERILGFPFHRGVLCCVQRPPEPSIESILSARRLVVLPRLDNVDNLGQILRSATALGIDAVLVGQGPSPFERRTVRVSMGAVWRLPVLQTANLTSLLERWRAHAPGEIVGAALKETALDARDWVPASRTALVLGPEDKGLDTRWMDLCDRHVMIPMARGMDSLNVAAAGAILMHRMIVG